MKKRALIITVKNPVVGKVKTRLAEGVGEERALEIYRRLLRHTRQVALQANADRYLYYSDFVDETDSWPNSQFIKKLQAPGDIGQRMSKCFEEVAPQYEKVVLIGCDIPGLSPPVLEEAFEKLSRYDLVIGPAKDGGYYLIGMKTYCPAVFVGIPWSTSAVFEKTIAQVEAMGLGWAPVATLADIDTAEDWEQYGGPEI